MKKITAAMLSACILSAAAFSSFPDQTSAAKTKGDINGDGAIDGSDATMVLRAYGQLNSFGNCGIVRE